jgi:hypothetical protein
MFGFIITRHVCSSVTNLYWQRSVMCLRRLYPRCRIIIIDDHSDVRFLACTSDIGGEYEVIDSEYPPGCGEILPYMYWLRYAWFPRAVILHDSVFFHRRIPFELFTCGAVPIWHAPPYHDDLNRVKILCSVLRHGTLLMSELAPPVTMMMSPGVPVCFGAQTFMTLTYLRHLESTYGLSRLVQVIRCRRDRCAFERVLALLLARDRMPRSVLGNIYAVMHMPFRYTYTQYVEDAFLVPGNPIVVKVWSGR